MTVLGTLLGGRYRLDAQIGRGGMSTVYRAFDIVLERPVAIKLMHREIAADSDQLERFRREARSVAQLNHPHIVTVIDAGEELVGRTGERPGRLHSYIVLEYVDGETLKDLIRREGPLEIPQAIAYAIEIARALGAAHERQIVHRDVKPQNVLIGEEGGAKITDFGIARTLTEEGLTMAGRVLGTTDYVSPEQALGQPVTGQSDLYSLGIVLYEMLTGAGPVPRRLAGGGRDEARARGGPRRAAAAPRALRRDRRGRRPRGRQGPRRAATPTPRAWSRDLEEVLAIEASRSGQATGEVTSVLRTLPGPARRRAALAHAPPGALGRLARRCSGRSSRSRSWLAAGQAHRGTGVAPDVDSRRRAWQPVALGQTAAHDYNPFGTGPENRDLIGNVVDGDPNTTWSTEQYYDGTLQQARRRRASGSTSTPRRACRRKALEIQTPTPGFAAQIYVADHIDLELPYGDSTPLAARGWQGPVGASSVRAQRRTDRACDRRARPYRYYLVWLTTLPPSMQSATISELTLFK